ncbi:T9SS type A sorting domain-containing protein [Aureivirga sp. CE67]|uniref:T9SS type A sorting domain-containing protein n=1 Tax=Aureivirga sp. CE67 TaxID=1788983 RepID=UPI0018CAD651|nr:T9SS type A sorting domain-containing protein [Aureivirga sp. CE67]
MRKLILLLFLFAYNFSNAQRGPGGVETTNGSSDLTLWLDANRSVFNDVNGNNSSSNNNEVSLWRDVSGRNIKSRADGYYRPKYKTNSLNGYPTLYFDGSNDFMTFAEILNPRSMFIVYKDQSTKSWVSPFTNYKNVHGFGHGYENNTRIFHSSYTPSQVRNGDNYVAGIDIGNGGSHARPNNYELHSRVFQSNMENYTNYSNYWGGPTYSHHKYFVGADRYHYRSMKGNIAEIITFDRAINLAERIIIENYLSAKYRLPLNSNNFYKMDNSGNGNFDHHVAGIGRASNGSTHLQSRGTGIVEIKNPSSISSTGNQNQFLFWGSDTRDLNTLGFEQNGEHNHMLNAKWRADKQANVGSVTVSFDLSEVNYDSYDCTEFKLLVSNTSNFTSNVQVYDLTLENGVYTVDNVNFNDKDYFTIEYAFEISWDGASYYNGSNPDYSPSMADGCMKMTVDNQVASGTHATLSEDATVKELEIKAGNTLVVENGVALYVEDEIKLNGDIRLIGDAQIIQKHSGTSKVSGNGNLYRQRESEHPTKFTIQYLSSPVSVPGSDAHDVIDVIHTGGDYDETTSSYEGVTAVSVHVDYAYDSSPHGASASPLVLSNYWFWKFINGSTYHDWQFVRDEAVKVKAGEGFSIKGTGRDETYVFIGRPNDGTYTTSISSNNESLLGNPYPSALDAHKFINDNASAINGTLYLWDHVSATGHTLEQYTGGFATLNLITGVKATHLSTGEELDGAKTPKQYLPVGQGFFVKGSATGGTITFDNSQRIYKTESSDDTTLLRNSNNESSELGMLKLSLGHFTENADLAMRQIAIGFKNGLTTSHENGFDSEIIDMQPTDFYWNFDGNEKNYVIAGVSEFNLDQELPLVVRVEKDGVAQFILDEKSNIDAKVFIKDMETQMSYELTEEPFEYILDEGVYENRFRIIFKPTENLGVDDELEEKSTIFYAYDSKEVVIKSNKELKEVQIYNLLGQRVVSSPIKEKATEYRIPVPNTLNTGVYIVNVLSENGNESLKIKL